VCCAATSKTYWIRVHVQVWVRVWIHIWIRI